MTLLAELSGLRTKILKGLNATLTDQALQLSRALAAAAANAIAADKCDVHNKRPPEGGLSAALIGAGLIRLHGLTHFALASVNRT